MISEERQKQLEERKLEEEKKIQEKQDRSLKRTSHEVTEGADAEMAPVENIEEDPTDKKESPPKEEEKTPQMIEKPAIDVFVYQTRSNLTSIDDIYYRADHRYYLSMDMLEGDLEYIVRKAMKQRQCNTLTL